jgi:hypothetical protein
MKAETLLDQEGRIRKRAYEIWETEGRPHGRNEEHWEQATGEIRSEQKSVATPTVASKGRGTVAKSKRRGRTPANGVSSRAV